MAVAQPNILLITTDQQRYDASGGAGPSFLRTPHYDRLRYEGVEFTSGYTDDPVCVPSRMGIMTGKQVFTHGMSGNGITSKILGREGTLPWYLRELGYQTIAIGKMHFGPERVRHGFDEMVLPDDYYRQMRHSGNDFPADAARAWPERTLSRYGHRAGSPNADLLDCGAVCSSIFTSAAILPYRSSCGVLSPSRIRHSTRRNRITPCTANHPIPEPVIGDWRDTDDCPPAFAKQQKRRSYDILPPEVIREARSAYYGLITQIDYNLARVYGALEDLGLYHETLIIYTSDHGEFLGDHRAGGKSHFHEPSAHVPFAMRMPSSWDNRCHGTQVATPVTHADILPTLLKAAGGDPPADTDGQDLVAVARGEHESPRRYLEGMNGPGPAGKDLRLDCIYLAITDGCWKYIWYPEGIRRATV